jgi:glycosyltransferase involved in cell wall biosynthesis
MKIGFDGKRALFNFRGLGNYSRGIIEGLLDCPEHECFLFAQQPKDLRSLKWLQSHESKKLKLIENQSTLSKLFPAVWRSVLIKKDLMKTELDIYHGLSHEIPFGLQQTPFKKVVTMHDLIFMRYPEYFPWIDRKSYYQKFTYACRHSDLVLAICDQTKKDLIDFLQVDEKKIVVHYQSCDPHFYQLRNEHEIKNFKSLNQLTEKYILNVGAFEERKNQKLLIEAFSKLVNKIPHHLVLIGNGKKYLDECKDLITNLGLNSRVKILQNISFNDLPLYYQGADLFCFPSHFEGFGIPIVEALFSNIPVITSLGSCFPESAGPSSVFIDSRSLAELSMGIEKTLQNPEQMNQMKKSGLEFAKKFERKQVTTKLVKHYSQLLN